MRTCDLLLSSSNLFQLSHGTCYNSAAFVFCAGHVFSSGHLSFSLWGVAWAFLHEWVGGYLSSPLALYDGEQIKSIVSPLEWMNPSDKNCHVVSPWIPLRKTVKQIKNQRSLGFFPHYSSRLFFQQLFELSVLKAVNSKLFACVRRDALCALRYVQTVLFEATDIIQIFFMCSQPR